MFARLLVMASCSLPSRRQFLNLPIFPITPDVYHYAQSNNLPNVLKPDTYNNFDLDHLNYQINSSIDQHIIFLSKDLKINYDLCKHHLYDVLYLLYSSLHYLDNLVPHSHQYILFFSGRTYSCHTRDELLQLFSYHILIPRLFPYTNIKYFLLLPFTLVLQLIQLLFLRTQYNKEFYLVSHKSAYKLSTIVSQLSTRGHVLHLVHDNHPLVLLKCLFLQCTHLILHFNSGKNYSITPFFVLNFPSYFHFNPLSCKSSLHLLLSKFSRSYLISSLRSEFFAKITFRRLSITSIFHSVRFCFVSPLASALNNRTHINYLFSHGSHVSHTSSSLSKYSDFPLSHGILWSDLNNIIPVSQSLFSDYLLREYGIEHVKSSPCMYGFSDVKPSPYHSTLSLKILYIATIKSLGARCLTYHSSFQLLDDLRDYLKKLHPYNSELIINVRFIPGELSQETMLAELSDYSNFSISNDMLVNDLKSSHLVVSHSSTVLEEALHAGFPIISPSSQIYSHFSDLSMQDCLHYDDTLPSFLEDIFGEPPLKLSIFEDREDFVSKL